MEEAPLKQVGRYDLLEVIGRGGAAIVYLARQTDLQRYVALKELAPFHAADATFAERFVEEGRLAGAMSHANIVTVHEFFETDGVPYIAMEYLPHGSLRQYIDRLSLAQIAGVLEGVLAGLSHGGGAHGIVHRDLKPENLLVAVDGRVKIADFGVARAYNNAATRNVVTVTGTTIGTPAYMSPEQALGAELTPACDLYSLGVVAWELFTGQTPFGSSDTPVAVLYRHVHEEIPPVRALAPDVDPRIEAWIARLLAKEPEARYASADEAWYALEDVILDLSGPLWRREARLPVDDTPTVERAPLAPASFTDSEPRATPGRPAAARRDTDAPLPVARSRPIPPTAGALATVAPSAAPHPGFTTILRPARRHRDPGPQTEDVRRRPWRRRLGVAAILAVMAGAAVAGVLLAAPQPPAGPTRAQLRADRQAVARAQTRALAAEHRAIVAAADGHLTTLMKAFLPLRQRAVTRFDNSQTYATQIASAQALQKLYARAARRVAPFHTRTPKAAPLARSLRAAGAAYGRLAAATRAQDNGRFAAAQVAIKQAERTLQHRLAAL